MTVGDGTPGGGFAFGATFGKTPTGDGRTPMYAGGGKTPMYGSQTPMYGSQTPMHDGGTYCSAVVCAFAKVQSVIASKIRLINEDIPQDMISILYDLFTFNSNNILASRLLFLFLASSNKLS